MEKILQITRKQAKELYPTASPDLKRVLEINFGKKTFYTDILDILYSYEDACEILGRNPINFNGMQAYKIAQEKLETIIEAANEDWFADYSNDNQKWYPWFMWRSGAFRFYYSFYTYSYTYFGSRLCCKTEHIAEVIGKRFESLWNIYLIGK